MGAAAKLGAGKPRRRDGTASGKARLRPITRDDVTRAMQRLRAQGRTTVANKELVAEVLSEPQAVAGTWLDEPVVIQEDSGDERVLKALQRLVVDQPVLSPWAKAIGATYRSTEARQLLHLKSRQALHNWVKRGKVLAVTTSDGEQLYPAWQFAADGSVVDGLGAVLSALTDEIVDRWTLASWLRRPLPELDGASAVDALLAGRVDEALAQAQRAAARWSR